MPTNTRRSITPLAKRMLRRAVPLGLRKHLAVAIGRSSWLPHRYYWSMEVIRDLAERDPESFHRFLWGHHVAYAQSYEPDLRFAPENIHPSRRLLFEQLAAVLEARGVDPSEVDSVLEVGCSLGYLLHHVETHLFPDARVLHGVDIDGPAIEAGSAFLAAAGSAVRLMRGDMADLDALLEGREYDVVLCAGTLMYLDQPAAAAVVDSMVRRANRLVVLAGLADPRRDNRELSRSGVRARDHSFVHNLDAMVEAAGGSVVARRWEGDWSVDGNTVYFVFAEPAASGETAAAPTASAARAP